MTAGTFWQPEESPDRVQLHMGRTLGRDGGEVSTPSLPAGFELVPASAAQAPELAGVLGGNGELGEWDPERARRLFDEGTNAQVEACFLALGGGQPVATAQLDVHRFGTYAGLAELGWVAVLPEMRGRRLGSAVSQPVLHEADKSGHRQVFLRTDERRLAAIVSYLALDFRPWLVEPTASGRWQAALRELDTATRAIGEVGLQRPWAPGGPGWDIIDWDAVARPDGLDHAERSTSGQDAGS